MIERIRYFLKEGVRNIWANRMMSLASILVLTLCLLLLGTSVLLSMNMSNLMKQMEKENQIAVFIKDSVDDTGITRIGESLKNLQDVEKVTFVSKDEALDQQKKNFGDKSSLLSGLEDDNPLPNSYNVTLNSMQHYSKVVAEIKKIDGVDTVNENSSVAEKLNTINSALHWVGFWLFIILGAVSIFVISYTIKLATYVRRKEVNIMKFVGATDWFIRWPFLVEGLLIGLIAGAVASVVQFYLYNGLFSRVFNSLLIISNPVSYSAVALPVTAGFLVFGVALASVGSLVSVHKYLRV